MVYLMGITLQTLHNAHYSFCCS